jgi:hypothetical protein
MGSLIAKYQISNGGPIILVQSENEYTGFASGHSEDFTYENMLKTAFRNAGVKVPLSFNDASPSGHYTSVDLWGYDSYPNGFDCSNPTSWGSGAVPTYLWDADRKYAPAGVPNNIYEFQGGKLAIPFYWLKATADAVQVHLMAGVERPTPSVRYVISLANILDPI